MDAGKQRLRALGAGHPLIILFVNPISFQTENLPASLMALSLLAESAIQNERQPAL